MSSWNSAPWKASLQKNTIRDAPLNPFHRLLSLDILEGLFKIVLHVVCHYLRWTDFDSSIFLRGLGGWVQGLCGSLVSVLHLLLLDAIFSASLLYLLTTSLSSLSPSYFYPWQNEMMGKIPTCDASCLLSQKQIKVGRHNKMIPF